VAHAGAAALGAGEAMTAWELADGSAPTPLHVSLAMPFTGLPTRAVSIVTCGERGGCRD
jgi:hypothetical protein